MNVALGTFSGWQSDPLGRVRSCSLVRSTWFIDNWVSVACVLGGDVFVLLLYSFLY
jgi:hypothetical protein